jgi:hypothetical protein
MKPVQEYTKVLSVRLVDARSRKETERARTALLRERREAKGTVKYATFAELRASALVN